MKVFGSLRQFEDTDVDEVVALSLRAWEPVFTSFSTVLGRDLYERMFPDWRSYQAESVRKALGENESWVSVIDSSIAGFVNVTFDSIEATGEIYMIAVDPAFQRQGIARGLTDFALEEMRRRGMTLATVGTGGDPGHAPARRTYEQAGITALSHRRERPFHVTFIYISGS